MKTPFTFPIEITKFWQYYHLKKEEGCTGKKLKCYGLTPEKSHDFINTVKSRNTMIEEITIDTEKFIQQNDNISSKNQKYAKIVFIISLLVVMISTI